MKLAARAETQVEDAAEGTPELTKKGFEKEVRRLQTELCALQEWVKQRLRSSRVPTAFRYVDQLPYNEMGKLLRRVLKQQFADRLS